MRVVSLVMRLGSLVLRVAVWLCAGSYLLAGGEEVSEKSEISYPVAQVLGDDAGKFFKVVAIIQSCKTQDQWDVAKNVVEQYGNNTSLRLLSGQITLTYAYNELRNYGIMLAELNNQLIEVLDVPERLKIGV